MAKRWGAGRGWSGSARRHLWLGLLFLAYAVLGGCVPIAYHYLRVEAPDGRYFGDSCRGGVGPRSLVYYPYHGIFISLDINATIAFGLHVPAGTRVELNGREVHISGTTDQGPLEVSFPIGAAAQGTFGPVYPGEFVGLPDPFSSPDNYGPLTGLTQNGRYIWYLFVAYQVDPHGDPKQQASTPSQLLRGSVELPPMTIDGQQYGPQKLHFERRIYAAVSPINC